MRFKELYTNGCSLMAGSGLDNHLIKHQYEMLYGVSYKKTRDITFPSLISKHFSLELTDESMSGSGPEKLVRNVYNFLDKRKYKNLNDVFFLLEINMPTKRLDVYCKKYDKFLIVNVEYNDDGSLIDLNCVDSYSSEESTLNRDELRVVGDELKYYISKYHNPFEYEIRVVHQVSSLLNYMESLGLQYLFVNEAGSVNAYKDFFPNRDSILDNEFYFSDGSKSISEFCEQNNLTLISEVGKETTLDSHPGYYGHRRMADEFIKYMIKKYPINIL